MIIRFDKKQVSIENSLKVAVYQIIYTTSSLLYPLLIKYIIDEAILKKNYTHRTHIIVFFISLSLITLIFSLLKDYAAFQFFESSKIKLNSFILKMIHNMKYDTYIKSDTSSYLNLFEVDIRNIVNYYLLLITDFLSSILVFLGTFYILLTLNYKLTFICFSLYPFYFILLLLMQNTVKCHIEVIRNNENIEKTFLHDEIKNTKIIRINNLIHNRVNLYSSKSEKIYATKQKSQKILLGMQYAMSLFNIISSLILIVISLYFYNEHDNVTIGTISAFYSYVFMLYGPLMLFAQTIITQKQFNNSKENIMEYV